MKECDNSKIHISSNFTLSISFLIMFDTLVLRPSLHCNAHFMLQFTSLHHTSPNYTSLYFAKLHHTSPNYISLHFATLHHTSPNYTSLQLSTLHFLSFTLQYPLIQLYAFIFPIVLFHLTSLN
jgi:hypothetical protein